MKKLYFIMAALIVASMVLAACGAGAPAATEAAAEATAAPVAVKVGQVTDLGGIDDKSFNATAYAGVEKAVAELAVEGKYLESTQQADYAKNIQQFVTEGMDMVITVGFNMGVDTAAIAKANPNTKAMGTVIESRLDRAKGPVATLLVQNGTLFERDIVVAGSFTGKIRAMYDENNRRLDLATPAMPA